MPGGPGRRGRRRCGRRIQGQPASFHFHPAGEEDAGKVHLLLEEFEAVRLVDHLGLTQTEAAVRMGISQKTLWNDLAAAREKIADALVHGKQIVIQREPPPR
ncbi:MAG: DUF134 domain-containing protein [Candidatus Thermoplasmatota archaeon]|nr:DUF134 domain-containing protein [Candidatus Thermoplasmatota archaeon]